MINFRVKKNWIVIGVFCSLFFVENSIAQHNEDNQYAIYQNKVNQAWKNWTLDTITFYLKKMQVIDKANCNWDICLNNCVQLEECFYFKNNFDSLLYYLELPQKEQWLGEISDTSNLLDNYWNLWGVYYSTLNDYQNAVSIFENLLELHLKKTPINYPDVVAVFTNSSDIYSKIGDYNKSIIYAEQGLLYQKDSIHINTSKLVNNQGFAHLKNGQFQQAKTLYLKSLNILCQLDNSTETNEFNITICQNIANTYKAQGKYEKATHWLSKALKKQQDFNIDNDILLGTTHRHLGEIQLLQGQYQQALINSKKGLELRKSKFGNKHPKVAMSHKIIGDIYAQQNQPQTALNHYNKAIQALNNHLDPNQNPNLQHPISGKTNLLKILQAKAQTLQQLNTPQQALATYQTAINLIDTLRLNYIAEGSKYILLEKAVPIYEGAIQTALQLNKNKLAFQLAEKSKAVLLLENIKNLQAQSFGNIPETTLEKERDIKIQIAFTERQLFDAQQKEKEDKTKQLQQKLFNLKYGYQNFLKEIERQYPNYYQLKYDTKVTRVEQVQRQLLNEETALIEFFVGEENITIFVVTNKNITVFNQPKTADFEENIQQFRQSIARPTGHKEVFEDFTAAAWYFYKQLMQPFINQLDASIQHLVIIPDGQLNYIPFQALIQHQADGRYQESRYDTLSYLVQDFTMSYAYSSTLLLEMEKTKPNKKEPKWDFGGFAPVFEGVKGQQRDSKKLTSLVNSLNEVRQIDSIVNGVIFLEQAANKQAFTEKIDQYRILHLATHASVNDSFPINSRIHFIDDYMTVGEIYNLPLNAELAVLSACETGTGRLQKGEGLMSLARAFTYAGCPSLVTSLWQVDDYQTSEIMIDFYKNLYGAAEKNVALRQAQLTYLNQSLHSYEHKHPFYWAGFILVGNSEAVFENGIDCWWIWFLLGVGILFSIWGVRKFNVDET